eukprot:COSAG04_NODE_1553_length_6375_cov_2.448375_3_plen_123_part_00
MYLVGLTLKLAKALVAPRACYSAALRDSERNLGERRPPRYLYWEAIDMLRKLALVGVVLVVDRGSAAQLFVALLLSFLFFALQVRIRPYKIAQDNTFRAATEFQRSDHQEEFTILVMLIQSE